MQGWRPVKRAEESRSQISDVFGMKITNHEVGGTVFDPDVAMFDVIVNEVVSNVEMMSFLATGLSTILFEEHCAFFVLIDDVVYHFNTLGFKK
jgi:hypothetical protein